MPRREYKRVLDVPSGGPPAVKRSRPALSFTLDMNMPVSLLPSQSIYPLASPNSLIAGVDVLSITQPSTFNQLTTTPLQQQLEAFTTSFEIIQDPMITDPSLSESIPTQNIHLPHLDVTDIMNTSSMSNQVSSLLLLTPPASTSTANIYFESTTTPSFGLQEAYSDQLMVDNSTHPIACTNSANPAINHIPALVNTRSSSSSTSLSSELIQKSLTNGLISMNGFTDYDRNSELWAELFRDQPEKWPEPGSITAPDPSGTWLSPFLIPAPIDIPVSHVSVSASTMISVPHSSSDSSYSSEISVETDPPEPFELFGNHKYILHQLREMAKRASLLSNKQ